MMQEGRVLRLLSVAGTRPEAIKLAPLALAARDRPDMRHVLVHTGQHGSLFEDALAPFGLGTSEALSLAVPGQSPDALADRIRERLVPLLHRHAPDMVIVQGDTTTAWAAAHTAADAGFPLAHVEAGLRSGDPMLPWPEERNRTEIDAIADLLFAPTDAAAANLRREGVRGAIHVTGNSGIDALLHVAAGQPAPSGAGDVHRLLVTCHRRENQGPAIDRIAAALRMLARRPDVRITVVLHLNPAGAALRARLAGFATIDLLDPLSYPEMIAALRRSTLVLSDSGGLQEECPALGVPLLVLRDNSERPEAIATGNVRMIGTQTGIIVAETARLLDDAPARAAMREPAFPYGRGGAARAMLDRIARFAAAEEERASAA